MELSTTNNNNNNNNNNFYIKMSDCEYNNVDDVW